MHFGCYYALNTVVPSNSTTMKFWRSRAFDDVGQRSHVSCLLTFSKGFFSETAGPILFKFHMQPSSKEGKKVYVFSLIYMTKMAATPIYGHLFLQNHLADCIETWYIASWDLVLVKLCK